MLTPEIEQSLLTAAAEVRRRAYAPYSQYHVGAALLTAEGQIISGCNVENASYGLTICAERAAVFSALAQGHQRFAALALVTADGAAPCGACRQVLAEFCNDLPLVIADESLANRRHTTLAALLPERFKTLEEGGLTDK